MSDRQSLNRPPLTLIVNSQEWHARSLESILGPQGYAVLRAYNGKQAIERAHSARPDLIFVDTDLSDRDGFEVCRELRNLPSVSACTPILMTSSGQPSRQKRIDAFKAGAWDFIGSALDGEELPLRLDSLVRAKQEADRIREDSLLDEITGLYNLRGLARRARELGSQAFRHKEPFACLVITPMATVQPLGGSHELLESAVLERLAKVLRSTGRTSDAIGTLGPGEFAIVAEGTDSAGVERLAQRVADAAAEIFGGEGVRVAIGYDVVPNYSESPIDPTDMLTRASSAMRASRENVSRQGARLSIHRFDGSLN
jgi:two-component system, cell cycle response regulator